MTDRQTYYVTCWNCSASFNAMESTFCSHSDPSVLCPYCFKCFCNSPGKMKEELEKNAPSVYIVKKEKIRSGSERRLGEILFNSGKIGNEELTDAVKKQGETGKRLGEIFVEMGIIKPDELELYLIGQRSKEDIEISEYLPDLDLIERVGVDLCLKRSIIPLEFIELGDRKILKIVVKSGSDFSLIKEKGDLKEYMVIPCYGKEADIDRVMEKIRQYREVRELINLE